jgi:hypothetical protein
MADVVKASLAAAGPPYVWTQAQQTLALSQIPPLDPVTGQPTVFATTGQIEAGIADLTARMAKLESGVTGTVWATVASVDALVKRVTTLEAAPAGSGTAIDALTKRVVALEALVGRLVGQETREVAAEYAQKQQWEKPLT